MYTRSRGKWSRADQTVGEVLRSLEESGQASSTLVLFLSDNGVALPFAKANYYLASTRTPWRVRQPGVAIRATRDPLPEEFRRRSREMSARGREMGGGSRDRRRGRREAARGVREMPAAFLEMARGVREIVAGVL